jgi:hypothetical protein
VRRPGSLLALKDFPVFTPQDALQHEYLHYLNGDETLGEGRRVSEERGGGSLYRCLASSDALESWEVLHDFQILSG